MQSMLLKRDSGGLEVWRRRTFESARNWHRAVSEYAFSGGQLKKSCRKCRDRSLIVIGNSNLDEFEGVSAVPRN